MYTYRLHNFVFAFVIQTIHFVLGHTISGPGYNLTIPPRSAKNRLLIAMIAITASEH